MSSSNLSINANLDRSHPYVDIRTGEALTVEQLIERYNPGKLSSPVCGVEEWARLNMVSSGF